MISRITAAIIASFFFCLSFSTAQAIDEQLDQRLDWGENGQELLDKTHLNLQTFKPSLNYLTKVSVYINTLGLVDSISYQIFTNGETIAYGNVTVHRQEWVELPVNKNVIPGNQYSIILNTIEREQYWISTGNEYSDGYAMIQGVKHLDKDFYFRTYGYNKPDITGLPKTYEGHVSTTDESPAPEVTIPSENTESNKTTDSSDETSVNSPNTSINESLNPFGKIYNINNEDLKQIDLICYFSLGFSLLSIFGLTIWYLVSRRKNKKSEPQTKK